MISDTITPARDKLCRVISEAVGGWNPSTRAITDVADAILAEGYSKPRTITGADELEALAKGAVVLDAHGESYQRIDDEGMGGEALWSAGDLVTSSLIDLPATVLHEAAS